MLGMGGADIALQLSGMVSAVMTAMAMVFLNLVLQAEIVGSRDYDLLARPVGA